MPLLAQPSRHSAARRSLSCTTMMTAARWQYRAQGLPHRQPQPRTASAATAASAGGQTATLGAARTSRRGSERPLQGRASTVATPRLARRVAILVHWLGQIAGRLVSRAVIACQKSRRGPQSKRPSFGVPCSCSPGRLKKCTHHVRELRVQVRGRCSREGGSLLEAPTSHLHHHARVLHSACLIRIRAADGGA